MQYDIGIVGGGVVGKAAALGLIQLGLSVVLISPETSQTFSPFSGGEWDTRVYALNHLAKALLEKIKIWGALDHTRIATIDAMQIREGIQGGALLTLEAASVEEDNLAFIVEEKNLQEALNQAIQFAPHLVTLSGSASGISSDFSVLTLEDGRTLQAKLWIGADGGDSWLRYQAGIGFQYRSYDQMGVVSHFHCSLPHHHIAHQWFAEEKGIIALLPLPDDQVSLVWSAPTHLAQTLLKSGVTEVAEQLRPYCDDCLGTLTPFVPNKIQAFPLRFIAPERIAGPRFMLIGDAAHVIHPLAGHGLNLGLGDVVVLLDVIANREAWRDVGDVRLGERYMRERNQAIWRMQIATDGLARLFGSSYQPLQLGRQWGLKWVDKFSFLKRKLIEHAMYG